jgi:hypothetical protein
VLKDVQRISQFAASGWTAVAYSVFIDEGGHLRQYAAQFGAEWFDWDCGGYLLTCLVRGSGALGEWPPVHPAQRVAS